MVAKLLRERQNTDSSIASRCIDEIFIEIASMSFHRGRRHGTSETVKPFFILYPFIPYSFYVLVALQSRRHLPIPGVFKRSGTERQLFSLSLSRILAGIFVEHF